MEEFLLAHAARRGVPVKLAGRDFTARASAQTLQFAVHDMAHILPLPALPGQHQIDNAALALACADYLRSMKQPWQPVCKPCAGPRACRD